MTLPANDALGKLLLRLTIAFLMLPHGIAKVDNFNFAIAQLECLTVQWAQAVARKPCVGWLIFDAIIKLFAGITLQQV